MQLMHCSLPSENGLEQVLMVSLIWKNDSKFVVLILKLSSEQQMVSHTARVVCTPTDEQYGNSQASVYPQVCNAYVDSVNLHCIGTKILYCACRLRSVVFTEFTVNGTSLSQSTVFVNWRNLSSVSCSI